MSEKKEASSSLWSSDQPAQMAAGGGVERLCKTIARGRFGVGRTYGPGSLLRKHREQRGRRWRPAMIRTVDQFVVYADSEGSAHAGSVRRCEFDPAFQWLTGLEEELSHTADSAWRSNRIGRTVHARSGSGQQEGDSWTVMAGRHEDRVARSRSFKAKERSRAPGRARQPRGQMAIRETKRRVRSQQARARARQERQKRRRCAGGVEKLHIANRSGEEQGASEHRRSRKRGYAHRIETSASYTLRFRPMRAKDNRGCRDAGGRDSRKLLPAVDRIEERLKNRTDRGRWRHTTREQIEKRSNGNRFLGSMDGKDAQRGDGSDRLPPAHRLSTGGDGMFAGGKRWPRRLPQKNGGCHLPYRGKFSGCTASMPGASENQSHGRG